MNSREKPTESEKKRERDEAQMEGEGGTGKDSPSRYLEGMRADLEVGATPVDGLVVSAMQDGKRLEEGLKMFPAYVPSKVWHWLTRKSATAPASASAAQVVSQPVGDRQS